MLTIMSLISNMATIGLCVGASLKIIMLLFPETSTRKPDQETPKS